MSNSRYNKLEVTSGTPHEGNPEDHGLDLEAQDELKQQETSVVDPGAEVVKDSPEMAKSTKDSSRDPLPPVPWQVWVILPISCFGVFMASVSTSALVIAFPTLLDQLDMTLTTMIWILLGLLLVIGAVVPTAGKMGDIFGQANVYKFGYVCFVAGSLGAGFVSRKYHGYDLLAARCVTGLGAAFLFTNSSAIVTTAFAPYGRVPLAQGIYQLSSAMGTVFGPLIGGAFSTPSLWRWIFWFNVPPGGLLCLAAMIFINDKYNFKLSTESAEKTTMDRFRTFDYIGSFFSAAGLTLILIALIQAAVPDPHLDTTGAIVGLVVGGCIAGLIFIVDQFYATDPLIPPSMFLNPIYTVTVIDGGFMAFVRNSITYNMIFFLQGPYGQTPLNAGIYLIPYGIGVMCGGLGAGATIEHTGFRNMATIGPLVTLAASAALLTMDHKTSLAEVEILLFLAGLGVGLFQTPNSSAGMLSVDANKRGVAAATNMLINVFSMMLGIIITFTLVLHYLSLQDLFNLFVFGGGSGSGSNQSAVNNCIKALQIDYYIIIAFCVCAAIGAFFFLPKDLNRILRYKHARAKAETSQKPSSESGVVPTPPEDEEVGRTENQENTQEQSA